jgi:hypothetical protein
MCQIVKNCSLQSLTPDKDSFTLQYLLGTGSGEDRCEEATLFGPPSGTVGISQPSGGLEKKHT